MTMVYDRAIDPLLKWQWNLPEPLQLLTVLPVALLLLALLAVNFAEAVIRVALWRGDPAMIYTDYSLSTRKLQSEGKGVLVVKDGRHVGFCILVDDAKRVAYTIDADLVVRRIEGIEIRIVDDPSARELYARYARSKV